jgi:hypothetical protein
MNKLQKQLEKLTGEKSINCQWCQGHSAVQWGAGSIGSWGTPVPVFGQLHTVSSLFALNASGSPGLQHQEHAGIQQNAAHHYRSCGLVRWIMITPSG